MSTTPLGNAARKEKKELRESIKGEIIWEIDDIRFGCISGSGGKR